jgi:glycosyltransferase involved in cell wall biosynthesis
MGAPLILVSNYPPAPQRYSSECEEDITPRLDYMEIAQKLGGHVLGYGIFDSTWYKWALKTEKRIKLDFVEAFYSAARLKEHNLVLSASEKSAIPLAMLLSIGRQSVPHVVIGHKFSSGSKVRLFNAWKFYQNFTHIICVCRSQVSYVVNNLQYPESKVDFAYDKVDHHFFRPLMEVEQGNYILAVGQEQRDYGTLLKAVSGTDFRLVIVASSPWSSLPAKIDGTDAITILRNIPYQELRSLYAGARLIIVPLYDVDYAAGSNSVLEAMAMSKPLIVSHTSGIDDYVIPNETGIFVAPENPDELRDAILGLWNKRRACQRLGENARFAVEEKMNLDIYVNKIVRIVNATLQIV